MKNYIVINGKKSELTKEQLKQLGIKVEKKRKNPFNSEINIYEDMPYYMIDPTDIENGVATEYTDGSDFEKTAVIRANSFNDKAFANQVYLHELLNRKLLKYAYDHEAEDCEWDSKTLHYYIVFDSEDSIFTVHKNTRMRSKDIYFSKVEVAENAIEDVIKPFWQQHPEFIW